MVWRPETNEKNPGNRAVLVQVGDEALGAGSAFGKRRADGEADSGGRTHSG